MGMFKTILLLLIFTTAASGQTDIDVGPYVQFTGPFTAVVRWDTPEACDSIVEYGTTNSLGLRVENSSATTAHEITLNDLQYKTKYYYRVGCSGAAEDLFTDVYTFDNAINYTRMDCSNVASPYPADALSPLYETAAERIISQTGVRKGYCLVYGCGQGRLAFEIVKRSDLIIVGVDTDPSKIHTAINKLMEAGVYGARIKVRQVVSLDSLQFTKYFFNLIVSDYPISEGVCVGSAAEMFRVLRPSGGIAYFGQPAGCPSELAEGDLEAWLAGEAGLDPVQPFGLAGGGLTYATSNDNNGLWCKVVRRQLPGAGEWPHQYGNLDNAAFTGETLEGATQTDDLTVQWIGWPGADFGADRNPRMPPPVMANGRLYYQGLDRILAMDSYNGAIYWSLEIPGLLRVNTPRDGGYICADRDGIYVAVDDDCWYLDGDTGIRTRTYKLNDDGLEWGYVGILKDILYGSAQLDGAHYTNIWGGSGWYDHRSDPGATAKVCSKYLFADDESTGARLWTYDSADPDKGVIINPTITIYGGRIYFVESRDPDVQKHPSGRIGIPGLWKQQYLVSLNADTGAILWQQPINPIEGVPVFYLVYANHTLILVSSNSSTSQYYLYAYDADTGSAKAGWSSNPVSHSWTTDNHGGHIQHPVVIGNKLYLEPRGYDIDTGADLGITIGERSGCATRAGTTGALIYRGSGRQIAMWDIYSGAVSVWDKLRPSCWLSTIPAGGMVLSPEGGGGCSCNEWFQTSVGFVRSEPGR
jgi:SAM-dependent methyltransferase